MNISSSFRDPSGVVFLEEGKVYRKVNTVYKQHYDYLMSCGLYDRLVSERLLIPHNEISKLLEKDSSAYKIIKPESIPFISYPYEWCFSQLKDAALAMLKIQKIALEFGMILKDSSAYNIQFRDGKPVLIDTLSFEKYREGQCWTAYRQFCQHFLAPLALMSHTHISLNQLLRVYIDGVPLDVANVLLPLMSRFKFSLFSHIHMQTMIKNYYEAHSSQEEIRHLRHLSKTGLSALVDNLESTIQHLKWKASFSEWPGYYEKNNYSPESILNKQMIVSDFLDQVSPKFVFDFGANIGFFSRISSSKNIQTVSIDNDYSAVEHNYLACVADKIENILPLVIDITNPSPGIGWENNERMSFIERSTNDTILALALIHHLTISHNIPFDKIAALFKKICNVVIAEFVPKNDSQVQRLLATREDIFFGYTQDNFEKAFTQYFSIENSLKIKGSDRVIYLFRKL